MNLTLLLSKNLKLIAFYFFGMALLILLYLPVLNSDFFTIDDADLLQVPQLTESVDLQSMKSIFVPGNHIDYYPIRDLSYLIDFHILGGSPMAFRVHQLILVSLSVLFIALILIRFKIPSFFALFYAWLWALYPIHAEMLSWVAARKDVLAIFFILISVFCYLQDKATHRHLLPSLFFYILSVFSKASFVLLPFLALAFELLKANKKNVFKIKYVIIACFISLSSGLFQSWFYKQVTNMSSQVLYTERINSSLTAFGKLIYGWFYWSLNVVDVENGGTWSQINGVYKYMGVFLWTLIIAIVITFILKKKKEPLLLVGGMLLLYIPVSGLFFPHRNYYSVRYLEPLFLYLFLVVFIYFHKPLKKTKYLLAVVACFIVWGTYNEALVWASALDVRARAVEKNPQSLSLRAQYYSELKNEIRSRGARHSEQVYPLMKTQEKLLDESCLNKAPLKQEDCWRYWDIGFQLKNERASALLVKAICVDQPIRSCSKFKLTQDLFLDKNPENNLKELLSAYHYFSAPRLRFLKWTSHCFLEGRLKSDEYLSELVRKKLVTESYIKLQTAEVGAKNRNQLLSCLNSNPISPKLK